MPPHQALKIPAYILPKRTIKRSATLLAMLSWAALPSASASLALIPPRESISGPRTHYDAPQALYTLHKRATPKETYIGVIVGVVGTITLVALCLCLDLQRRRRRRQLRQLEEENDPRDPSYYTQFPVRPGDEPLNVEGLAPASEDPSTREVSNSRSQRQTIIPTPEPIYAPDAYFGSRSVSAQVPMEEMPPPFSVAERTPLVIDERIQAPHPPPGLGPSDDFSPPASVPLTRPSTPPPYSTSVTYPGTPAPGSAP